MVGSLLGGFGYRLRLDLGKYRFDAELVDAPQACRGHAQAYPAVLALDPEAAIVEIRFELADRLVVGVRDEVALHRLLAGDLTDAGHCGLRNSRKARII